MAFGPFRAITYRQLLQNLSVNCGCLVTLEVEAGIPDTDESVSGALYLIQRRPDSPDTPFAYVEVYHEDLVVLPDVVASICAQLGLDEDQVYGGRVN